MIHIEQLLLAKNTMTPEGFGRGFEVPPKRKEPHEESLDEKTTQDKEQRNVEQKPFEKPRVDSNDDDTSDGEEK